ncbi:uncharacterized protein [Temnothorax nylanderi]|uniref:uncharacterized protein n=1 Tax=Temnothorax nylanderi TaxID=102681 RepID=UPI003A8C7089
MREVKEGFKKRDEEIKDQREKIESLRRKVERLEQSAGKRKRDDSEERRGKAEAKNWWEDEYEENEEEERKKNVILRVERERWIGKGTNWEKVKELFEKGLKVRVEVKEVSVIGQRGVWLTVLVKMGSEEDKRRVLEARRREGYRLKVKVAEDRSVEMRIREREESERRTKRTEEDRAVWRKTEEDEIAKKMEESLLMESGEDEEDKKGK